MLAAAGPPRRHDHEPRRGVAASRTTRGSAGQIFLKAKDKELARLCVEAYNDWQVDEWCAGSDGRLIPLCLVPLWDVELAAAEVRRNAARGVKAVGVLGAAAVVGLASIHSGYWDPFFAACAETGTVVAMHIGSGTKTITSSDDAPTRCRRSTCSPTARCR